MTSFSENRFAPLGYEPVLPCWPSSVRPMNNSIKNFSNSEMDRGCLVLAEGLDAVAARMGVTDPELVEIWRSRWDALPPSSDGTFNRSQASTALYTELTFQWFSTAAEAEEFVAFFAQDEVNLGMYRKMMESTQDHYGRPKDPKPPRVDIQSVAGKVNRSRMSPKDYRTVVEIHGSSAVNRMVESLEDGGLEKLLDEGFPIRYMADVPAKWTRHLDIVAKAASMSVPQNLLKRFFDQNISDDDADYLFANVAPEYIDTLIPA